jgi:hydroxymethylglutaryl-CoA reductase
MYLDNLPNDQFITWAEKVVKQRCLQVDDIEDGYTDYSNIFRMKEDRDRYYNNMVENIVERASFPYGRWELPDYTG